MSNVDIRIMQRELEKLKAERGDRDNGAGGGHTGGNGTSNGGGGDLEARIAKLETHVEYIRRDLDEMKIDVKEVHTDLTSIKRRLAYFAGAGVVIAGIFAWVVNNRFDQVISLLAKAAN
jgi:hypothetical protein